MAITMGTWNPTLVKDDGKWVTEPIRQEEIKTFIMADEQVNAKDTE